MDLGSESVEENDVNHKEKEIGIKNDGSDGNDNSGLGCDGKSYANSWTPDQTGTVGSGEAAHPKVTPTKGYGLKTWKRIRRDVVKDPNLSADSGKILKRGLSGTPNLNEVQPFLRDVKQNSEGSSNAFGNVGFSDGYTIRGSSSDSRYALGSGFVVGMDSENREDLSSRSSTAASEPKFRYDKSRSRNMNLKNLGSSSPRVQQGKGRTESSKKPSGGRRVKIEKECSHSSMESDSRISNFKEGTFTVTSNGKHTGRRYINGGGNGGEAPTNENLTDEVHAAHGNENMGEDDDLLQENLATNLSWDAAEEKSGNNQPSTIYDPLIESISSLQAVQEALEEELQKFREIGNEAVSADEDSPKYSSASAGGITVSVEEIKQTDPTYLKFQVLNLTQNVYILESKLEELRGMLAAKDSRIAELEAVLSSGKSAKEESTSTVGLSEGKYREAESEVEVLYRQKVEAEVEYMTITNIIQNLKVAAGFQFTLLEEQQTLSENQLQVLDRLGEAESKASEMKNKVEELENNCNDILVVEEALVMQRRVCKVTFHLFVQFVSLIFFLCRFVSQLSPNSGVVVPT